MIDAHQPPHFPDNIIAAISSRKNGNMKSPSGDPIASEPMKKWLTGLHIDPQSTVGLLIRYNQGRTYDVIAEVESIPDKGVLSSDGWIQADALVAKHPGIALTLLTGDCNSPMFVDPRNGVIALAHAGWHSTVQDLVSKVVTHLEKHHGSKPEELIIHFPPSIRRGSYLMSHLAPVGAHDNTGKPRWHSPKYAFPRPDGRYDVDLMAYNLDLLHSAGVDAKNIEIADADTFVHEEYFSNHRRHYEPESARTEGRIATVIMRKP